MKDQYKTKKQLIEELEVLRNQLAELKKVEGNRKRVEETLLTTNERLNYLLTSTSAAIYTAKTSGDYGTTSITENVKRMTGYEAREFIENSNFWIDRVHPEDRERILNELPGIFEQESYIYEYRFLYRDGNYRWVRDDMKLIRDEFGNPIEIIGYWIDITERKQTEEALKESESRFRNIIESSKDSIIFFDGKTQKILFGNSAMAELLGCSKGDLVGRSIPSLHPSEGWESIEQEFQKHVSGEISVSTDIPVLRNDGSVFYADISSSLITLEEGTYFSAFFRDITERKQAEVARQESEEKFRLAFENANTGVCLVDLEGNLTRVNHKMCEIFGYTKEELEHMTVNDIAHPEDIDKSPEFIQETLQGERDRGTFEKRYFHKKEHVVTCQVSSSLVRDAEGIPLYFISHVHDITEHKQAEEQVRESQQRFQDLVETLSDWIWEVDQNGIYTYTSPKVRDLLGYKPEEVLGKPPFDLMPPEEAERVAGVFGKLLAAQQPIVALENTCLHKDGRLVVFETSGAPFFDAEGRFKGYRGVDRDITARKKAEEVLQQKTQELSVLNEQLQFVLGATKTNIDIIDTDFNLIYIDRHWQQVYGDPTGRKCYEYYMGREQPCPTCGIPKALETKQTVVTEEVLPRENNRIIEVHTIPFQESDGRWRVAEFNIDITERKKAEEALQKEREISLSILENAPYGVALIDKDGNYIYINPEFTNITGYTLKDIPNGKDWFRKAFSDPKDRERVIQVWKEDRSKGNLMIREFSIHCKDGKIREIEIRSTFLRDGRVVFVLHDITEQKRAEEKMESLQEQLRQSQKMEAIGRLAGGIAHDFNNLLTVIKGYSQLSLIELKEDTPLKGNIEHIHTATDRAADLVRQLLAFSRRQILEMKVLDLNTTLANLHNMLRRLIGEDIELTTVLAEDLGRVKTDLGWIEQAIMNLVVNARDAMPSGGKLTIETGNADLDEAYVGGHVGVKPGRYVMLSVSDTGVGMSPEVRERLFEPFFSTKEKDKGTGLGLSTVYGIVKQSGGDIWVYSEPGKGSTFKIYLPRVDEPLEQPREKVLGDELLRGSETILLVEDEEEVRKLAVRVLERQGYKVLAARDGDEALLICEQHQDPIHLMLTDVVMPGMNGHEVAKRLESFHPEMKVLYMSGYTDNAIVLHGVLVEGVNYIQKPFTVDALTKKVREVLEQ